MKYHPTPLEGACTIEPQMFGDERGFFARVACRKEFAEHGLNGDFVQINSSLSAEKGTLRGMHYQAPPHREVKLVRCLRGAIYDVIVDLRPDSPTFGQWTAAELTAKNRLMMYAPEGFAHGMMTLEDDTEIIYFVTAHYAPDFERGVRWDDPKFAIEWPMTPTVLSDRDRNQRDFDPAWHLADPTRET